VKNFNLNKFSNIKNMIYAVVLIQIFSLGRVYERAYLQGRGWDIFLSSFLLTSTTIILFKIIHSKLDKESGKHN